MKRVNVERHFHAWRFQNVLKMLGRKTLEKEHTEWKELTVLQIGSLVFTGDLTEALSLFSRTQKKLSEDQRIMARFYLGIGHVRRSEYQKGAGHFSENLLLVYRKRELSDRARFHAYQGAAFLNFFKGHYDRSLTLAQRSYENALSSGYTYGEVLALDLLAHAHCQLGKVRQGIHEFKKAIELIREIGNGGLETALRISELRYRAQFGINPKGIEAELLRFIQELRPEETYSRAELHLELARQLVLRGRAGEAQRLLDESSDEIYRHQNRRQSAQFNLRYAHILFLRGENHGALALLRSSVNQLDLKVDTPLLLQFRGLENRIQSLLGKKEQLYSASPVTAIDHRIRIRGSAKPSQLKGEDPLGDILDELEERKELLIPLLIERDYLGLIPRTLGMSLGGKKIFLGPERGKIILINQGDVEVSTGLTGPLTKLLHELKSERFRSKAYLVKAVWSYDYNPLVHDNVLYTNIARLRSILRNQSEWIEWSSEGYRLSQDVELVDQNSSGLPVAQKNEKAHRVKAKSEKVLLNLRQIEVLRLLDEGGHTDVSHHARRFEVTTMTACRDLSDLFERGLVTRVGRARATKYVKNTPT